MKNEVVEKLNVLNAQNDTQLIDAINNAGSLDEIVGILNEKGVEVKTEDLTGTLSSGELTEDALEEVSGGAFSWNVFKSGYNDGYEGKKKKKDGDLWYCIGYGIGSFLR